MRWKRPLCKSFPDDGIINFLRKIPRSKQILRSWHWLFGEKLAISAFRRKSEERAGCERETTKNDESAKKGEWRPTDLKGLWARETREIVKRFEKSSAEAFTKVKNDNDKNQLATLNLASKKRLYLPLSSRALFESESDKKYAIMKWSHLRHFPFSARNLIITWTDKFLLDFWAGEMMHKDLRSDRSNLWEIYGYFYRQNWWAKQWYDLKSLEIGNH